MKRLVNGVELDLPVGETRVETAGDRLLVSTPQGKRSGLAVRIGDATLVSYLGQQYKIEAVKAGRKAGAKDHTGDLISPMPGSVVDVLAEVGQSVVKGDKIVVLEAMKTQQTFAAPFDGKVVQVHVMKGEQVGEGVVLAVVEPAGE
jgi:3-methylcrotonyl-CoA carboxylase alpha subunit